MRLNPSPFYAKRKHTHTNPVKTIFTGSTEEEITVNESVEQANKTDNV